MATAAATSTTPATTTTQKVFTINNRTDFENKIAEAGSKLVVVEFFAPWCGPCKMVAVKLEELAKQYQDDVLMMKLDVDECEEVAIEYNVTSMPTFLFMRNKKKVELLVGSDGEKLAKNVEKLCNAARPTITPAAATTAATTTTAASTTTAATTAATSASAPTAAKTAAPPTATKTATTTAAPPPSATQPTSAVTPTTATRTRSSVRTPTAK